MTTFRIGRWLAVLVSLSLLGAACTGDDADTTEAEDSTDSTEAPEAPSGEDESEEPEEEPEEGASTGALSGLTEVDDTTFTVELTEPDPEFALRLSYAAYYPLPSVALDDPTAFEEAPVGNGPFQMDGAWDHDISIRVTPYADYAGSDPADVSSLTFNIYEDSTTTGYLDLQAGVNDFVRLVPAEQTVAAREEFGERFGESENTGFYYYGFPTYLEEQYPLELRRALSMALDRQLLIDAILDGTRTPASSVIPPALAGYREEVCDSWNFDAEAAKAEFEKFGGLEALGDEPLVVWFNTSESHEQIAEAVTGQWRDVLGIENIEFQNLEFSEYLPLLDNQEATGVFRLGWGMDYPSPLNFLEPLFASYSAPPVGSNSTFYDNPDFDAAIAAGREAVGAGGSVEDGVPSYQEAEDLLCADAGIMPIYFSKNLYAWNDTVEDYFVDAFGDPNYTQIAGGDVATAIGEPEHLIPTDSGESEGITVLKTLFKGLVDFDPQTTEPVNEVAESIETTDGGKTWTITIKDGWTFHDGEPVTASSFINAWSFGADPENAQSNNGFYSNIVGYEELNPPGEGDEEGDG